MKTYIGNSSFLYSQWGKWFIDFSYKKNAIRFSFEKKRFGERNGYERPFFRLGMFVIYIFKYR